MVNANIINENVPEVNLSAQFPLSAGDEYPSPPPFYITGTLLPQRGGRSAPCEEPWPPSWLSISLRRRGEANPRPPRDIRAPVYIQLRIPTSHLSLTRDHILGATFTYRVPSIQSARHLFLKTLFPMVRKINPVAEKPLPDRLRSSEPQLATHFCLAGNQPPGFALYTANVRTLWRDCEFVLTRCWIPDPFRPKYVLMIVAYLYDLKCLSRMSEVPPHYSPNTLANRVRFLTVSLPDFRVWESFRTMSLVGGISREYPVSPALLFRRCCMLASLRPHRFQDLIFRAAQISSLTHRVRCLFVPGSKSDHTEGFRMALLGNRISKECRNETAPFSANVICKLQQNGGTIQQNDATPFANQHLVSILASLQLSQKEIFRSTRRGQWRHGSKCSVLQKLAENLGPADTVRLRQILQNFGEDGCGREVWWSGQQWARGSVGGGPPRSAVTERRLGRRNQISGETADPLRKPLDQLYHPARRPHAKIRERTRWEYNPVRVQAKHALVLETAAARATKMASQARKNVGTHLANQRLVSDLPGGSLANKESFAARTVINQRRLSAQDWVQAVYIHAIEDVALDLSLRRTLRVPQTMAKSDFISKAFHHGSVGGGGVVGRGYLVDRPLASHLGEPGSNPDFCMWESCCTMPLEGGFSRESPVSPALAFRRCSILIPLHPHRFSRTRY
ncbi:hypothetical protein PR048_013763 [Dryococelus australis]|uniref:Uncharacterized protein n=1 Tax=Dryococelus australis TaxID=614101 RepID=A0ABQ9HT41_9NEOP|nr:hypothetical protein PR048_013763 [Dryococelus australis]